MESSVLVINMGENTGEYRQVQLIGQGKLPHLKQSLLSSACLMESVSITET